MRASAQKRPFANHRHNRLPKCYGSPWQGTTTVRSDGDHVFLRPRIREEGAAMEYKKHPTILAFLQACLIMVDLTMPRNCDACRHPAGFATASAACHGHDCPSDGESREWRDSPCPHSHASSVGTQSIYGVVRHPRGSRCPYCDGRSRTDESLAHIRSSVGGESPVDPMGFVAARPSFCDDCTQDRSTLAVFSAPRTCRAEMQLRMRI
jgi:hypothetical protein